MTTRKESFFGYSSLNERFAIALTGGFRGLRHLHSAQRQALEGR